MEDLSQANEALFNGLVKDNHASIYRICRAYLYDPSQADDLYQEILFQVWKSIQTFKGASMASTWIYRIAINTAINYNLKNKRHQHLPLPDLAHASYDETISAKQEQEAQLNKLRYCISLLETQDKLIISLILEEKSYKDIAEIMGSNTNNIGVKVSRIKASLLKLMENLKENYNEL